jgi:hypothetical protein
MLRPTATLSWNQAPIWGLRPDLYYCQTVAGLLRWGALSDERTGLPFTIAAGARQHSNSWVRVPWDSRPYFNVSDSTLPFSSPPTIRKSTVEVFDPASTWDCLKSEMSFSHTLKRVLRELDRGHLGRRVRLSCKGLAVARRTTVCLVVAMESFCPLSRK